MTIANLTLCDRRVIGPRDNPMMIRYVLFRISAFGVYLHNMRRSDFERALHDHPWPFVSIVLKGGYFEHHNQTLDGIEVSEWRKPGSVLVRSAEWRHRFELNRMDEKGPELPSWTLVFVGRRARPWGFFLPDGWCWWRKHNPELNICEDHIVHQQGKD